MINTTSTVVLVSPPCTAVNSLYFFTGWMTKLTVFSKGITPHKKFFNPHSRQVHDVSKIRLGELIQIENLYSKLLTLARCVSRKHDEFNCHLKIFYWSRLTVRIQLRLVVIHLVSLASTTEALR
jgi:hypothetical protein